MKTTRSVTLVLAVVVFVALTTVGRSAGEYWQTKGTTFTFHGAVTHDGPIILSPPRVFGDDPTAPTSGARLDGVETNGRGDALLLTDDNGDTVTLNGSALSFSNVNWTIYGGAVNEGTSESVTYNSAAGLFTFSGDVHGSNVRANGDLRALSGLGLGTLTGDAPSGGIVFFANLTAEPTAPAAEDMIVAVLVEDNADFGTTPALTAFDAEGTSCAFATEGGGAWYPGQVYVGGNSRSGTALEILSGNVVLSNTTKLTHADDGTSAPFIFAINAAMAIQPGLSANENVTTGGVSQTGANAVWQFQCDIPVRDGAKIVIDRLFIHISDADADDYADIVEFIRVEPDGTQLTLIEDGTNRVSAGSYDIVAGGGGGDVYLEDACTHYLQVTGAHNANDEFDVTGFTIHAHKE